MVPTSGSEPVQYIETLRVSHRTVTGPASCAAGGWATTPGKFGCKTLFTVTPQVQGGYTLTYDTATSSFMVYAVVGDGEDPESFSVAEVADETDLSEVVWRVTAFGV